MLSGIVAAESAVLSVMASAAIKDLNFILCLKPKKFLKSARKSGANTELEPLFRAAASQ